MKNFKITYALWFAISLAMSSCSCCRVDVPPLTTAQNNIFSKYKIGDTISLKSDSCEIKVICTNIYTTNQKANGGGTTRCFARSTKFFDFQFTNFCGGKNSTIVVRTIVVGRTRSGDGNEVTEFKSIAPEIYYDTLHFGNIHLQNVRGMNFTELLQGEFPEVFYDSTGFVLAANSNRTIIYK